MSGVLGVVELARRAEFTPTRLHVKFAHGLAGTARGDLWGDFKTSDLNLPRLSSGDLWGDLKR